MQKQLFLISFILVISNLVTAAQETDPIIRISNERAKTIDSCLSQINVCEEFLIKAVATQNILHINYFIEHGGINVNYRNKTGITPLHVAAKFNCPISAKALIVKGADINAQDIRGNTPLNYAIRYYATEAGKVLLDHFAETNLKSNNLIAVEWHLGPRNERVSTHKIKKMKPIDVAILSLHWPMVEAINSQPEKIKQLYAIINEECQLPAELNNIIMDYFSADAAKNNAK